MSILVTDSSLGILHTSALGMPQRFHAKECPMPYMPCASSSHLLYACKETLHCYYANPQTLDIRSSIPAMPALTSMQISPCERYLYQLSCEVDYVHTRHLGTGDLLYAAPCGVFPKSMQIRDHGKHLLIAGGLCNHISLFTAPDLHCEQCYHTPHACFFADFWQDGLLLLCAKEGDDIQTIVYTLPKRAVRPRKLLTLAGPPSALCVCPDGITALLCTPNGLMKMNIQTGVILWNLPQWAFCENIHCIGNLALLSSTLTGEVCLLFHDHPWYSRIVASGLDAQACFVSSMDNFT